MIEMQIHLRAFKLSSYLTSLTVDKSFNNYQFFVYPSAGAFVVIIKC